MEWERSKAHTVFSNSTPSNSTQKHEVKSPGSRGAYKSVPRLLVGGSRVRDTAAGCLGWLPGRSSRSARSERVVYGSRNPLLGCSKPFLAMRRWGEKKTCEKIPPAEAGGGGREKGWFEQGVGWFPLLEGPEGPLGDSSPMTNYGIPREKCKNIASKLGLFPALLSPPDSPATMRRVRTSAISRTAETGVGWVLPFPASFISRSVPCVDSSV